MNIFDGIASEEFALLGFEPVKRIVFAALVQNLRADVGIRRNLGAAQATMHRECAGVAEQIKHTTPSSAFAHFQSNRTHVEEQPRIHRVEQIDVEFRRTFADYPYRIFRAPHRHFHRRVLQRLARTGKAFLYNKAKRRELFCDGGNDSIFFAEQFITEKLNLVTVTELVERQAGETVRCPVHNAESLGNP